MKIIYNEKEYSVEEFADIRKEKGDLKKYGAVGYVNYLRIFKDMDLCWYEEE